LVCALALISEPAPSYAGYSLSIERTDGVGDLLPGERFTLAIRLDSSDGLDLHNSAIFWLNFSEVGLLITNYAWALPYVTGGVLDQSTSAHNALPLLIDADTYKRPGEEGGLIDLEFSNVLLSGRFGEGVLLTAEFMVPDFYAGSGVISIAAEVDTIADGFDEYEVAVLAGIDVIIIPAPFIGAIGIAVLGVFAPQRRRQG
jgi:hypothetical protein